MMLGNMNSFLLIRYMHALMFGVTLGDITRNQLRYCRDMLCFNQVTVTSETKENTLQMVLTIH